MSDGALDEYWKAFADDARRLCHLDLYRSGDFEKFIPYASTRPGDWCLDCFAGSGTLGAVAAKLGRRYVMIDCNPQAVEVMRARLGAL